MAVWLPLDSADRAGWKSKGWYDGHSVLIFVDHLVHCAYRSSFHASGKRTFQWGKGVSVGKRRSPSGLTAGFMKFGH